MTQAQASVAPRSQYASAMNSYEYVNSRPSLRFDPSGLRPQTGKDCEVCITRSSPNFLYEQYCIASIPCDIMLGRNGWTRADRTPPWS